MNEQSIALKLDDVEFRRRRRVILTKVNLEVKKGEKWVLFGPNGIGKSTLVQMIAPVDSHPKAQSTFLETVWAK